MSEHTCPDGRIRVYVLGTLHLERRVADGRWEDVPPTSEEWGTGHPTRSFLRYLLAHGRCVGRGTILETLWTDVDSADRYLYNAASTLRRILRSDEQAPLLETIYNRTTYKLADQSRVWVDVDHCTSLLQEGKRIGLTSERGLRLLQEAELLFRRGPLFADEPGDWCFGLREQTRTMQYRCQLWLAEAYEAHQQLAEAEIVVEALLTQDPTDERALRQLMTLLHKQGLTSEAVRRYRQTASFLKQKGQVLSAETEAHVQAIQGVSVVAYPNTSFQYTLSPAPEQNLFSSLPPMSENGIFLPLSAESVSAEERDWATWFGLKLAQLITVVEHWQGQAVYADRLQTLLDREIIMFDTVKPQNESHTYTLSRRQMLIAFASTMALGSSFQAELPSVAAVEKVLSRGAASITAGWHLLKGSELPVVEQTLSTYLLTLVTVANQPSPYQKTAAKLASQAYRLYGIVALHRNNLQAREWYCQQALYYSEIAANPSSQVSALISLASTYYYSKKPEKAAHTYQKALLHSENIPPLQRSRLHAELAVVSAQQKHEQEALQSLDRAQACYPEHPENDPSFLYAEFSPSSLILEQGLTHLALAHHFPDRRYDQIAWETFAQIETLQGNSVVPERILLEILNKKAEAALITRNLEGFYTCIKQGIQGAIDLQSKQRMQEAIEVYEQAKMVWADEARVKRVLELFPLVVQKGSK